MRSAGSDLSELDAHDRFDQFAARLVQLDELDTDSRGALGVARLDDADDATPSMDDPSVAGVETKLQLLPDRTNRARVLAAQEHPAFGDVLRAHREKVLHGVELQTDEEVDRRSGMTPPLLDRGFGRLRLGNGMVDQRRAQFVHLAILHHAARAPNVSESACGSDSAGARASHAHRAKLP